ncbi:MAG: heparinase II/III family protein [Alphaproteobacteria bacterium]|nr:heparinase II/III family protein [Alphaproteobacteria bacterium]
MSASSKILQQVRRKVKVATYGSPIYRLMLDQGPVPERLCLAITDPWPGNAAVGQAIIAGGQELFPGDGANASGRVYATSNYRDLRAVGTETARRKAVELISDEMEQLERWQEDVWEPDVLGERIAAWISFYDFYSTAAEADFNERLIVSLVRQLRHLLRVQPTQLTGVDGLKVIKGLLYGGLGLLEGERALALALDLLRRQLTAEALQDGGHISRNPSEQLHMLRYLIDIRSALRAARLELLYELTSAIDRMVPALKLFRHGDGKLALFNGSSEESELWIEAAITLAETRGRVMRRLAQTGYERITAGRSLLLVDMAAPAHRPYDRYAHAGLLSFEFSVGRERIIVNCGAHNQDDENWRLALAATAAHSTLALEDTNACEILRDGGLGHRPQEVSGQRYEQDEVQFVEMMHDGYVHNFQVVHQRTLSLSKDGEELGGLETLSGKPGRDFALRWHLHPAVQVSLAHGGQTALLRTGSGAGWRLRAEGGDLSLESGVYCGNDQPRRSMQLKLSGRIDKDPTVIKWSLVREKK